MVAMCNRHVQNTAVLFQIWPPAPAELGLRIPRKLLALTKPRGADAAPIEDFIWSREATKHSVTQHASETPHQIQDKLARCSLYETHIANLAKCAQCAPVCTPDFVDVGNTRTSWTTICPENLRPCLCFVWPPQPCRVTPCHVFQTPNGP